MVASQGGKYTKHIYIGSQRIVSKLGDLQSYGADPRRIAYAGSETDNITVDYKKKYSAQQQSIKNNYATFEVPYNGKDNNDYVDGQGFCCNDTPKGAARAARANDNPELFQYYYHPDHLGSSSFITNLDGDVAQHIEYVPYGEVFIEEKNASWTTPYKFNAKELDEETGLYYYGARYYDPKTSVWISPDALKEKYFWTSAYVYALNNPVRFTDPDGNGPAGPPLGFMLIEGNERAGMSTEEATEAVSRGARIGLRYTTPIEDIYGVFTGKDFEGNSYNRAEAATWAIIGIVPTTKLGKFAELLKISSKELKVTMYGAKHFAPVKMAWKNIVESTLKRASKFKNTKEYVELTKKAWDKGKSVTNGKPWKVFEAEEIIGAASGKETKYMRVELTESTKELHSSPITKEDYQRLLKK